MPVLIYDGDCGFCKIWISYWKHLTGDAVEYSPSQQVGAQYPGISSQAFQESVQLVRDDGSVASGARAVFEALGWERTYERVPGLAPLTEWAYRLIARNRSFVFQATRLSFGTTIEPSRFANTQWLFLKLLAAIYAIAFASLAVQVTGLLGEHGITPAGEFLNRVAQQLTDGGQKYFAVPSLFWISASDTALVTCAWAGVLLALVALAGYFERAAFIGMYAVYLSFSLAGQVFLGFQWDALLLEAGFLAIFFGRSERHQRRIAWLYRWLVFRLYFLSGWVKLSSGDTSWRDLSALRFHFYTQPLPTQLAWYADKLPDWLLRGCTFGTLFIELAVPFLIFAPRRIRMAGATLMIALQALIFLTGNYAFFNLLTVAMTMFLFDDLALPDWRQASRSTSKRWQMAGAAFAAVILLLGWMRLYETAAGALPRPLAMIANGTAQFQIANPYGLFAVMTKSRSEIVIEGSDDGVRWMSYDLLYQPGDPDRAPRQVAPHQPRLDWQMWFAALDDYRASPWFESLVEKLLAGTPEVNSLLARNPFPQHPPKYIRALLYDYTFADKTWWKRQLRGTFFPAVSLRE